MSRGRSSSSARSIARSPIFCSRIGTSTVIARDSRSPARSTSGIAVISTAR